MYVIDRQGKLLHNYRKHHLYETDKPWCTAGEGFQCVTLTNLAGQEVKAGLAICMDLNPKDFINHDLFELGDYLAK